MDGYVASRHETETRFSINATNQGCVDETRRNIEDNKSSRHDFPSFQKDFRSWIRFLRFPILEGKNLLLFSRKNGTGIVTRLFRGCSEDRDDNVTGIIRNRKMDRKGRRFSIRK